MSLSQKEYEDNLRRYKEQQTSPENLPFSFSCQQCGHRCCKDGTLDTVLLSPYTAAFINKYKPLGLDVSEMVEHQMLETYLGDRSRLPILRHNSEGGFCPFLAIDWSNLGRFTGTNETEEYFFLLLFEHTKVLKVTSYSIHLIAQGLIKTLTYHEGRTYSLGKIHKFLYKVLDKYTLHSKQLLKTSCLVYPARPPVCRIFPLGRFINFNKDPENPSAKVTILDNNCPQKAFSGNEQTAEEYLELQDSTDLHDTVFPMMIQKWMNENKELVSKFESIRSSFSNLLFNILYVQPVFYPSKEEFYVHFNSSLLHFLVYLETSESISIEHTKGED